MKLFQKMNLPNTAGLGIRGFFKLPLDIGYAWFPSFNSTGELITFSPERLAGLRKTRAKMLEVLKNIFTVWDPVKIFFLGFSQGAIAAIDVALNCSVTLGGVVAISSSLIDETKAEIEMPNHQAHHNNLTPFYVSHGKLDTTLSIATAKQQYEYISRHYPSHPMEWHEYAKGHEMIKNQEEMEDIMTFFARHLTSKDQSFDTLQKMVKKGEIMEVEGVTSNGIIIK